MDCDASLLTSLAKVRPVGSEENQRILMLLKTQAESHGWETRSILFASRSWEGKLAYLSVSDELCTLLVSPYSPSLVATLPLVFANNLENLSSLAIRDSLLVLVDDAAKKPILEQETLSMILAKGPKAILALTSSHDQSGCSPFPLIEDEWFDIPSCYAPSSLHISLKEAKQEAHKVRLSLKTSLRPLQAEQLVFKKTGEKKGIIVIASRMDSPHYSPAGMDSAAALAGLYCLVSHLETKHTVVLLPLNGMAYPSHAGLKAYRKQKDDPIEAIIFLDAIGLKGSQPAYQTFGRHPLFSTMEEYGYVPVKDRLPECGMEIANLGPTLMLTSIDQLGRKKLRYTQLDGEETVSFDMIWKAVQTIVKMLG